MSKRFVYDYYFVDIPGDCSDEMTILAEMAIEEAKDKAKLYCVPAIWTSERISGEIGDFNVRFKVCRKRNRVAKLDTKYR